MGAVSSVNCFERWGRRTPDGPLIKSKPSGSPSIGSVSTSAGSIKTNEATTTAAAVDEAGDTTARRKSRRRPTAMPALASDTEASVDASLSEDTEEETSVADTMASRLKSLRRALSHVVRLKTSFFASSVKVTTDDRCSRLQWYPAKDKTEESEDNREKKAAGSIPIEKIVKVQVSQANNKAVEITAMNPGHETYTFTFKHQTSCQKWLDALVSLQKLQAMA